ncbi:minor capsid protein [Clostridium sp.]|uniref:minor capsid protein n=1 Tax=Clostridium sp. TaxID=1506 RepID=UPI003217F680
MDKNNHDELEFVEGLYDEAEEQIKEVYKQQKKSRDELLNQLALIMMTYTVLDGAMNLSRKDKTKEYNKLSKTIKTNCKATGKVQDSVIKNMLTKMANSTFDFYSYNAGLKDVQAIIDKSFKGKHFSARVWENEKDTAKHLHKQINDFLNGKINVNQIKESIEKTYNSSAYNAKRLTETEVARVENDSFKRFCRETGVKKVRRVATLDNRTCSDCSSFDGKVYGLRDAPDLPAHPLCRCYLTIEDEDYIENNSKSDIMKSGAVSGALNPYSTEAQNHAEQYYESARHMKTDTKKISENVGWKQNTIDKIKEHVFIKEHDLGNDAKERFYPSYDMAQSWQRLIEGKSIKEQDLVLLKHEYLELTLMKKGFSQANAHSIASKKHNFAKYTK